MVEKRFVDVGQVIGLDTTLFNLVKSQQQEIECEVDEVFINHLNIGQAVRWRSNWCKLSGAK